jgi:hypothetical protein
LCLLDQCAENHRGGPRIIERGMRGRDIERKHLDQPREARRLAFGKVEHHPGQG